MTTTTTITQFLTHTHKLSYAQRRHALFSILKKFTQIFFFFYKRQKRSKNAAHHLPTPAAPVLIHLLYSSPSPPLEHFTLPCQILQQQAINYPNTKLHFTLFQYAKKLAKSASCLWLFKAFPVVVLQSQFVLK